ncbi:sensor histidine kinase [Pseudonocardia sp.]|uniref:sensor histidine kinase n=1 Tax=Pseudonocardia sp. TaxID=60912 RepID=UPI003D14BB45
MTGPPLHRLAAAAVLAPVVAWAVVATPAFVDAVSVPCPDGICVPVERPSAELARLLPELGITTWAYAVAMAVLAWVGLAAAVAAAFLVLTRVTGVRLLAVVTAVLLPVGAARAFGTALAATSPAGAVLEVVAGLLVAVTIPLFVALFPDGCWHPRWTRWAWPVPAVVIAASLTGSRLVAPGVGESDAVAVVELATWLGFLGVQVHRYRTRSDWVARQQAKAVFPLLLTVVVVVGAATAAAETVAPAQPLVAVLDHLAALALYVGILVALFRYRLYGVDLAVRRTVVYGAAVALLAVGYVVMVALAGPLVGEAAPVLGGVAAGLLALAGALVAFALRDRLRRRLLGGQGLARALAALAGDRTPAPDGDVAATIATGLGLPRVTVLDRHGDPVWVHGGPGASLRETIVDAGGETVGALLLDPPRGARRLDRHHRRVLDEVLPFVVLVLRAREEAQELRAARAAAAGVREDERRRLRRELHDGVGPLLASQLLVLDTIRVSDARPDLLEHLEDQARAAIGEVRRLAQDLRPAALDRGGLPVALGAEAERLGLAGLPVQLDVDPAAAGLPSALEVALLRIAQEALTNVVKHADATSARVELTVGPDVSLVVDDDGRGRTGAVDGIGTATMRERATELGGAVEIGSGPGGRGTRVRARFPR